ncbi:MAG: pantoate--beta-alanine ligase [Ruminococcus sp.]|jgi:pantoate--beta-alanine ligase|nr:pantoate--beta-alanine ligase [Ruminococcus sp.]
MQTIKNIKELKAQIKFWKQNGNSIGFVPTMGYLHEGHQSLIRRSVEENSKTIVSIFVNPTQFAPTEDLDKYPRNLAGDIELCEKTGADVIFTPENAEMYAEDFSAFVDMSGLTEELCGKSRPTHFRGVCTVVNKLFNIVTPDKAYFGQKDAQQLAVIKRMVRDLNMNVEIVGCPIIRESDGLAKSSRNVYLSPEERKAALVLSRAIFAGEKLLRAGERNPETIITEMKKIIDSESLARIDYIEVVDGDSIEKIDTIKNGNILTAIAVFIGKTRLIDNFIYKL